MCGVCHGFFLFIGAAVGDCDVTPTFQKQRHPRSNQGGSVCIQHEVFLREKSCQERSSCQEKEVVRKEVVRNLSGKLFRNLSGVATISGRQYLSSWSLHWQHAFAWPFASISNWHFAAMRFSPLVCCFVCIEPRGWSNVEWLVFEISTPF